MLVVIALLSVGLVATLVVALRLGRRALRLEAEAGDVVRTAGRLLDHSPATPGAAVVALAAERDDARNQAALVRSVVDRSGMGAIVMDQDLRVRYASSFAQDVLDGRHGAAAAAQVGSIVQSAVEADAPTVRQFEVLSPGERTFRVEVSSLPAGVEPGVLVRIDDVSQAARVEATRRDFVANVSHELKTPVGAIMVLVEALADTGDEDVRRRLSARLSAEADRIAVLVDDILDLTRVQSTPPDITRLTVGEVIEEALKRVSVAVEESGADVEVELVGGDIGLAADRTQLVSAVANLVDNAVKHGGREGAAPRVTVRARRDHEAVVLEVEDCGVGIATAHRGRVFERFYRIDRGRSRDRGGTGLGLAIVRNVALNHGGAVELESAPGLGSVFRLRLPAAIATGEE